MNEETRPMTWEEALRDGVLIRLDDQDDIDTVKAFGDAVVVMTGPLWKKFLVTAANVAGRTFAGERPYRDKDGLALHEWAQVCRAELFKCLMDDLARYRIDNLIFSFQLDTGVPFVDHVYLAVTKDSQGRWTIAEKEPTDERCQG